MEIINGFLIPPHPLTSFEIQKYYQKELRFNGVYSTDNLPKIKDGAYVINLDEDSDIGTHWVALHVNNNNNNNNNNNDNNNINNNNNNSVTYFDPVGVEHIPEEIKTFIDRSLSITTNIFKIQASDSIMCGYFCIGFVDFMLAGKALVELTNLFSPNNLKTNDDIILNYFLSNV